MDGHGLPPHGGAFYRVVHRPRIAVRSEPSVRAEIVYAFPAGSVFHVSGEPDGGWVRLSEDERWVHELSTGHVLVDGAQLGLGPLIERLGDEEVTEDTWPYALAVRRAAELGVSFAHTSGIRPMRPAAAAQLRSRWLSVWHGPEDAHEPIEWSCATSALQQRLQRPKLPRAAVALLVRGVAAECLVSFVAYHLGIGFERVALFFDAPEEAGEREAVDAVSEYARGDQGRAAQVQIHLCTHQWWAKEECESRFYLRRHQADKLYRDMVELHETVHDVQARQCLVIDRAIRDAHRDGFDWLLHIDSDEALLVPQHRDVRTFFASVAADYDQVVFRNLEAVPEQLEVGNWFREVSLFKVNQSLLKEDPNEKPHTSKRLERLESWRKKKIAKGADPDDVADNKTFNTVMFGVRMARRDAAFSLDLDLPAADPDSEFESESDEDKPDSKRTSRARDVPCYYTAYTNGKAAVRLRRNAPPPLPLGVHRCASDQNGALRSYKCTERAAPVVLHYANCGFAAWLRKYQILSTGHGTEDGGFSVTRKGIVSMRAHLAHRELVRRGDAADMEAYYRTFIMGNEYNELAHFACHGLLMRTSAVRSVLEAVVGR